MATFDDAIGAILQHEGGYVNNPHDAGGETRYGISKRAYPSLDIKALTVDDAKRIYKRDYWIFGAINDQAVATKALDLAVWFGLRTSVRLLQLATCACGRIVVCDGRLGPITVNALNAIPPDELLSVYRQEAVDHVTKILAENPRDIVFEDGWMNRARS